VGGDRRPRFGRTAAPKSRELYERHSNIEETANNLHQLVISDSGKHLRLDEILRRLAALATEQARFAREVMDIFKAYDEERAEDRVRQARTDTKVAILLWVAGVVLVAMLAVLGRLAFK
jgi:hypothetical protein